MEKKKEIEKLDKMDIVRQWFEDYRKANGYSMWQIIGYEEVLKWKAEQSLSPSTDSLEVSDEEIQEAVWDSGIFANSEPEEEAIYIQGAKFFRDKLMRSKLKSQWVSVETQVCAKCNGEGYCDPIGTSSSVYRVCPVCNGSKLIMPVLLPTQ